MKKFKEYSFKILEIDKEKRRTKLLDIISKETYYTSGVFGVQYEEIGLFLSNKRKISNENFIYSFSKNKTDDNQYFLSDNYSMQIKEIIIKENNTKTLLCECKGEVHEIFLNKSVDGLEKYDWVLCSPSLIDNEGVEFYFISLDFEKLYNEGEEYIFEIIKFYTKTNYKNDIIDLVDLKSPRGTITVVCRSWFSKLDLNVKKVCVVYQGDARWHISYDKIINPSVEFELKVSKFYFQKMNNGTELLFVDLITENGVFKIACRKWLYPIYDSIDLIKVYYAGNKNLGINYNEITKDFYVIGETYPIEIKEYVNEGFYYGITSHGIQVQVLKPYSVKDNIIDNKFDYEYQGIDKNSYLDFRQKVKFSNIINSKALKILAFDHIRKDYKDNIALYEKLFKDYDSSNNLWVLSYGNTLFSVIYNKIELKEYETAFLLLEVLERIEKWILNSGFLKSFARVRRNEIEKNAQSIIKKASSLSLALTVVIEQDFEKFNIDFLKMINQSDTEYFDLYLSSASKVFSIINEIPSNTFNLFQLILDNKKIIYSKSSKNIIQDLERRIRNVLSNIDKLVYREVFVEPVKRAKYFNQNDGIKTCILILIWLIGVNEKNHQSLLISLYRHLSYFVTEISFKNKLILKAVNNLSLSNDMEFQLVRKYHLINDNIYDLVKSVLSISNNNNEFIKQEKESSFNFVINQFNECGYFYENNGNVFYLPYTDSNKNLNINDSLKVSIVTSDPLFNLSLVNLVKDDISTSVTYDDSIDYQVGDTVKGVVKSIVKYGIFINLGKVDGLLHSNYVSHNTTDLDAIFNIGEELILKIINKEDGKIHLSRIDVLREKYSKNKYKVGQKVSGKVFRIDDEHGVYLELENGANGFLRKNNAFVNGKPKKISNYFQIGEIVKSTVVVYDHNKGYELSLKKDFSLNEMKEEAAANNTFKAKIILFNDLKAQVENRLNLSGLNIDNLDEVYCPKCQKEEYYRISDSRSFLEISEDLKKWSCFNCDYHSYEQIILKFIKYPLLSYSYIKNYKEFDFDHVNGVLVDVRVENIYKDKFIEVIVTDNYDLTTYSLRSPKTSKIVCADIGYIYEEFAYNTTDNKENFMDLCRYYFGVSKNARSYFHSYYIEYSKFVNSLINYTLEDLPILRKKANTLYEYMNSESLTIETFPILNYFLDSLRVISYLNENSYLSTQEIILWMQDKSDNIELNEAVKLVISFNNLKDKHIKNDVWELLKLSFRNYLQKIKEFGLDEDVILLRKRIRKIIQDNKEEKKIECKGSYSIPITNKSDLEKIDKLKQILSSSKEEKQRIELSNKIKDLSNPMHSKELKEIVTIAWVKTIAAFANTDGGELFIGIGEDRKGDLVLLGLEKDFKKFKSDDDLILDFDSKFAKYFGNEFQNLVDVTIVQMEENKKIFYILVKRSTIPVFINKNGSEKFYIRRNASTVTVGMSEFSKYKDDRFQ